MIALYKAIQRNLYSAAVLGMDGYRITRDRVHQQFVNNLPRFREKMQESAEENSAIIFTEDLKNMVHLAENDTDVSTVVKMIGKYNAQNKELRFGNFVFGPVVFRMFYHLNDVDTALKCFKDPQLQGFFDQLITFQILSDMLYEKGRYSDVLEVFDVVKTRQVQGGKYPKHVIVLVLASCYKMNTPESFHYATKLWQELREVGHNPMRKAVTFAAGLALLQNAPHIALEMLSNVRDQYYMTIRNLKVQALAELNRPEDALPILRSVLQDDPVEQKATFIRAVVDKVSESIERNKRTNIESDFKRVENFLTENNHVTNQTMDEILCSEITSTSFNTKKKQDSFIAATFTKNNHRRSSINVKRQIRGREGLQDLY